MFLRRYRFLLSFSLLILLWTAGARAGERELVEVTWPDLFVREAALQQGLDIFEGDFRTALIYALPAEIDWLSENGAAPRRAEKAIAAMAPKGTGDWLTLAEYEADMQAWATAYPNIVSLFSIGQTTEGRDIWMLRLSDNAATDEAEPEAFLISLQHAREWLSGMTLHGVTEHLITSYGTDPEVTALLDEMEIYVVLVGNPDGYLYTHTTERLWRKNRRDNGDGNFGVDLNRNWPRAWQASTNTASNLYGGTAPFSEPETVAVNDWLTDPSRNVIALLNYHTYNTRVMHNWASTYDLPPNEDVMGPVVRDYGQTMYDVNGQRFRTGSWAITLDYIGGGATIDYTAADLGIPSLTLEGRPGDGTGGGFAPSASLIAPSVSENIPGAIGYLQWALGLYQEAAPPVISSLSISDQSSTTATLNWTTDQPARRSVEWGTTPSYGNTAQPDMLLGRIQSVTLDGLSPNTTYYYNACAETLSGATVCTAGSFTTAASAQDITPPGYPAILSLRDAGSGMMQLRYITLFPNDVIGSRLYSSSDLQTWTLVADETVLTTDVTTYQFPAPPPGEGRAYRMVNVDDAGNESIPSDTYAYAPGDGTSARVLVVDAYDEWNNRPIAQDMNHPFAGWQALDIADAGYAVEACANQQVGTELSLTEYDIVVWVLGDESNVLTSIDRSEISAFLEGGGNMLISGSEIAEDLVGVDPGFLSTYLSVSLSGGDADDYEVSAINPDSFYIGPQLRFDYGDLNVYRVFRPDSLSPANGSVGVLGVPLGNRVVGVQRSGVFGSGSVPGRLIYLSFPIETVAPLADRRRLVQSAMTWLNTRNFTGVEVWMLH